ncbi:MAG: nucleotidyltransferase family protein [Gemmatimonadetes bacterium]|nr:nucleotidyltransferase family protein [Gemmatimonadota bacterium]
MSDYLEKLTADAIAERFRWARRHGHPSYVWPEVPIAAWRACLREIERCVTEALRGGPSPIPIAVPEDAATRALGVAAFTSGMGPLLGYWFEVGLLEGDGDVAALLRLHLDHGRRRARRLAEELSRVLDLLASAGIAAVVVKGASTAHLYFPDPGTRPAADIDLVVPTRDLRVATRVLEQARYTPTVRQSRPYKCDWVPPGAPRALCSLELSHADNPYAIEVHDSLERTFFGVRTVRLGPADAANTEPWEAFHAGARVLAPPLELAFLAVHASEELHELQLLRIVELVFVIRRNLASRRLNWEAVARALEDADALRFAYPAFELAERMVPGIVDDGFRQRLARAATPRMRRVLQRLTPSTVQCPEALSLEERFMWAAGPLELARRAVYLLWPTHAADSRRPLGTLYAERMFRVFRGRVSLRTPALTPDRGDGRPEA